MTEKTYQSQVAKAKASKIRQNNSWCWRHAGSSSYIGIRATLMAIGFGVSSSSWTLGLPFFAIPVLLWEKHRKELVSVSRKNHIVTFFAGAFLLGHFFAGSTQLS